MNPSTLRARAAGILLALAVFVPAALAQAAAPPLLDRELFFGNPEIAAAQLSPDGKYIAFLKPWKDTRNVWVKKTGEGYDKAHLVTADPKRPIPGFFWSRDSKYILFVQDKDGDENYNVYAVDPAAAPEAGKDAPPARNLTDAKGARAAIYAVPKNDPDTIYVGLNDRDAAWHDVYKVKISTGERTLVRKNTERIAGWIFDNAGALRLADAHVRQGRHGDPPRGRRRLEARLLAAPSSRAAASTASTRTTRASTSRRTRASPTSRRLVLFDPATGKEELVEIRSR